MVLNGRAIPADWGWAVNQHSGSRVWVEMPVDSLAIVGVGISLSCFSCLLPFLACREVGKYACLCMGAVWELNATSECDLFAFFFLVISLWWWNEALSTVGMDGGRWV
ncbi:hypothetical protein BO78DRAFT_210119 [Aspergillus sclerotiicarbonarius CBS 121057]|uniref:Transmembrane protein n=1 Tax=Aspergillus sclerotiicarbonarius (strain CBS 121057 / IBT 28362) TaxID=1448318 RepID=A0A319DYM9_ASPSB|nr:hypothetical protein BO78DRAFT_210119 [Aspergillus sclerotiicarbonarius CBS 121057]